MRGPSYNALGILIPVGWPRSAGICGENAVFGLGGQDIG